MSSQPHLSLVGPGKLDAVRRKWRFEAAHLDVTIVPPATLNDFWRVTISKGMVPGDPEATAVTSYGLPGLMDQLEEIWPPAGRAAAPAERDRAGRRGIPSPPLTTCHARWLRQSGRASPAESHLPKGTFRLTGPMTLTPQ